MVQLFQILPKQKLQTVSCHANTDTSDLLGGLRPLRGRSSLLPLMIEQARQLEQVACAIGDRNHVEIPSFNLKNDEELSSSQEAIVHQVMDYAKRIESLLGSISDVDKIQVSEESLRKRRKVQDLNNTEHFKDIISVIRQCFKKYFSLFEWVDGPLVSSMKAGKRFSFYSKFTPHSSSLISLFNKDTCCYWMR